MIKFFGIPIQLFILLFLLMGFTCFEFPILNFIGVISQYIILGLGAIFFFRKIDKGNKSLYFIFSLILIYFVFLGVVFYNKNTLITTLNQVSFLMLAVALYNTKMGNIQLNIFSNIIKPVLIFYILIILTIFYQYGEKVLSHSYYSATLLKTTFALFFFYIIKSEKKFLSVCLFSFFLLLIGERAGVVILIGIYILYRLLNSKIFKNKKIFNCFFWIVIIICFSIPFIYVLSLSSTFADNLNAATQEYTNANFYSGRDRIWEKIVYFDKNPIFGYGIGNSFLEDYKITLSTHNLYLYLYLEGGIVLLCLFSILLFSFWRKMHLFLYDKQIRFAAAYFIGLLLFLDFELLLMGNNATVSIYLWFILCYGCTRVNFLRDSTIISKSLKPNFISKSLKPNFISKSLK